MPMSWQSDWCVPSYHRPHLKNPVGNVDKSKTRKLQSILKCFFFFSHSVLFSCNSYFKCPNRLIKHTYLPKLCQHASVAVCAWNVMSTQAGPKHTVVLPPQPPSHGVQARLGITGLPIPNCRKSLLKSWWALRFMFCFVFSWLLELNAAGGSLRAKVALGFRCCCCDSATVSPPYLAAFATSGQSWVVTTE